MEPFVFADGKRSLPRAGSETGTSAEFGENLNPPTSVNTTNHKHEGDVGYWRTEAAGWASDERRSLRVLSSKAAGTVRTPTSVQQLLDEVTEKEEDVTPHSPLHSSSGSSMYLTGSSESNWSPSYGNDRMSGRLEVPRQSSSSHPPSPFSASERLHASSSSSNRSSSSRMGSTSQALESICKLGRSRAVGSSASVSTTCSREKNRGDRSSSGTLVKRRAHSVPRKSTPVYSRSRNTCGSVNRIGAPGEASNSPNSNACRGANHSSNSIRTSVAGHCSGSETESFDSRTLGETDGGGEPASFQNGSAELEDERSNSKRRSKRRTSYPSLRFCSSSSPRRRATTISVHAHRITRASSRTCVGVSSPPRRRSRSSNKDSQSGSSSRKAEGPSSGSSGSASTSRERDCSSTPDKATLSRSRCIPKGLTMQKTVLSVTATTRKAGCTAGDAAAAGPAAAGTAAAVAGATVADSGAGVRAAADRAPGLEQEEKAIRARGQGCAGTEIRKLAAAYSRAAVDAVDTRLRSTLSALALTCPVAFTHALEEAASALATQQQLLVLRTAEALLQKFVENYETFIFDVDGVLLMGKRAFAGVAEGLAFLREKGKRLLFLTNSAAKSRRMCVEVLRNAGIHAELHEVVCSSYAAALHLQLRYPHVRKVFMVGEAGLEEELRTAGFEVVHAAEARTCHSQRKRRQAATTVDSLQAAPLEEPSACGCTKKNECVPDGAANSPDTSQGVAGRQHPANTCLSSPPGAAGVSAASFAPASTAVVPCTSRSQTDAATTGPHEREHLCCNGAHSCADVAAARIDGCLSHFSADQVTVTAFPAVGTAASSVSSVGAPRFSSEECAVCGGDRKGSRDTHAVLPSFDGQDVAQGLSPPPTFPYCAARIPADASTCDCQHLDAGSSPPCAPPLPSLISGTCAVDVLPASYSPPGPSVSSAPWLRAAASEASFTAPAVSAAASNSDSPPAASRAPCSSCTAALPHCRPPNSSDASSLGLSSPYVEDEESFTSLARSLDPDVDAVVVGWDRRFDYFKLAVASLYLQREGSLPFLAANRDAFDVVAGLRMPANGAAVAALETAAGRTACCVGKPSPWLAETLLWLHAIDAATTVVCGDRLDTDVAFGKHAGTHTCVTLTGCTTSQQLLEMSASHPLRPDAVCPHVGLLCLLKARRPTERETAE